MASTDPHALDLLRLTLVPGLGPARIARLLERFGTVDRIRAQSEAGLERVRGIGPGTARMIVESWDGSDAAVDAELDRVEAAGARLSAIGEPGYPAHLACLPGAPPLLYVRGSIDPIADRYPVAIVGSRRCTSYGIEQAERFAGSLARNGLTVVSGGARGIDTASHRGALSAGGRTICVLGCGLGRCYPPENAGLFDQIVAEGGAVVSELPMMTEPDAKNFPARNRIISGIALGVVVIEAARGSGALITARHAAEDHGREVMAVPGRVDSPASQGTLELLTSGGALAVAEPADVIAVLEGRAFHAHRGTLSALAGAGAKTGEPDSEPTELAFEAGTPDADVLGALLEPLTLDEVVAATGLDAGVCKASVTRLELRGVVGRRGARLVRR